MNHPSALPALSVGEQPLYLGGRQLSLTPAVRLQPYTWPGLKNWPEQGATPRTCTFSPVAAGCCALHHTREGRRAGKHASAPGLKNWPEPGGQNDAQLAALLQLCPLPRRSPYLAGNKKGPSKEGP